MGKTSVCQIKRGRLLYREKVEFKSVFHMLVWRITMRIRGFIVEEMHANCDRN